MALRRASLIGAGETSRLTIGDLEVDLEKRRVPVRGNNVHLTPIEYRLRRPGPRRDAAPAHLRITHLPVSEPSRACTR